MTSRRTWPILIAVAFGLLIGQSAVASDEWKFGIGTGFTSFSLDGDIGFATMGGGEIVEIDLDNSDTSDLFESGFGFAGFAKKGKWTILFNVGTLTLEDEDGPFSAEWDRTSIELSTVYNFGTTGNHRWGVLFGVRNLGHDWELSDGIDTFEFDEDWTDGLIGLTHAVPFADGKWSWTNHLDGGFGDSEGSFLFKTSINWHATQHWTFNLFARQHSIEFGDEDDIDESDFYLYDVDEPGIGLGFMFTW